MSRSTIRYSSVPENSHSFDSGSDRRPEPDGSGQPGLADQSSLAARWRSKLVGESEASPDGSGSVRSLPFTPGKTPDGWTETRTFERGASEWPHPENPGLITDYDGHYDWAGRRLFLSGGSPDPETPGAYRYQTRPDLCDPTAPDSEPVSPRYEPMWLRHKPGDTHQFGTKPFDLDDPGPFGNPLWRPDRRTGRHRYAELPDPIAPWDWQPGDPEPPNFATTGIRWNAHGNKRAEADVATVRGCEPSAGAIEMDFDDREETSGDRGRLSSRSGSCQTVGLRDREYASGQYGSPTESDPRHPDLTGPWGKSERPSPSPRGESDRAGRSLGREARRPGPGDESDWTEPGPESGRSGFWSGSRSRGSGEDEGGSSSDRRPHPGPDDGPESDHDRDRNSGPDRSRTSGPDQGSGQPRRRRPWEQVECRGDAEDQRSSETEGFLADPRPSPSIEPEAPHRFSRHREAALHNFLAFTEPFAEANRVGWERTARVGRVRQTALERECGATIALVVCVIRWIVHLVKGTDEVRDAGPAVPSEIPKGTGPSVAGSTGGFDSRERCGVSAARFFSGVRQGFAAVNAASTPAAVIPDLAAGSASAPVPAAPAPASAGARGAVSGPGEGHGAEGTGVDLLGSTIGLERVRDAVSSGRGDIRASVRQAAVARIWRSRPSQSSPFPVRPRSRPAPYIAVWEREFDSKSSMQGFALGGAL